MDLEERVRQLEAEAQRVREDLAFAKGKCLGLEAIVLVLAREWGNTPQAAIEALHNTMDVLDGMPAGPQKQVGMALIEQVSSALHSRNR